MSALKMHVTQVVVPSSTWKRNPGCCKFVARSRYGLSRRRHRVFGEGRLLQAHALRTRARAVRLLRRDVWRAKDDWARFWHQKRSKSAMSSRLISSAAEDTTNDVEKFDPPLERASESSLTRRCSSDTSHKRDGSTDVSSMAVPAVPMAEQGRVPRRNRPVRFASTHFCCGPEAHLNCVDVACGSDCATHSPRLSCPGLNPGGESCTSDVIVEDCTLLGGGMPSACREDDVREFDQA